MNFRTLERFAKFLVCLVVLLAVASISSYYGVMGRRLVSDDDFLQKSSELATLFAREPIVLDACTNFMQSMSSDEWTLSCRLLAPMREKYPKGFALVYMDLTVMRAGVAVVSRTPDYQTRIYPVTDVRDGVLLDDIMTASGASERDLLARAMTRLTSVMVLAKKCVFTTPQAWVAFLLPVGAIIEINAQHLREVIIWARVFTSFCLLGLLGYYYREARVLHTRLRHSVRSLPAKMQLDFEPELLGRGLLLRAVRIQESVFPQVLAVHRELNTARIRDRQTSQMEAEKAEEEARRTTQILNWLQGERDRIATFAQSKGVSQGVREEVERRLEDIKSQSPACQSQALVSLEMRLRASLVHFGLLRQLAEIQERARGRPGSAILRLKIAEADLAHHDGQTAKAVLRLIDAAFDWAREKNLK